MANKLKILKGLGLGSLIIGKAFWKATVEVTWGICGLILFGAFVLQYNTPTAVESIFSLSRYLMDNWFLFWLIIFALIINDNWYWINNLRFINVSEREENEYNK